MRIYDTFLFDGELDLLDHRLHETFELVDFFVLVESAETFRGQPKRLHFKENRERFAWASAKIRHIALATLGSAGSSPWRREALQRDAIMLGLRDAAADAVVLLLDVDEIASRAVLERFRSEGLDRPHRLAMTRHYEYIDMLAPGSACCPPVEAPFPFCFDRLGPPRWDGLDALWHGRSGVAARFADLCGDPVRALPARSAYDLRRLMHAAPTLPHAGRHFVSTDPSARCDSKLSHVSHTELADVRTLQRDYLQRARHYGIHHHGWWYAEAPSGVWPADLQRLAQRCPAMKRSAPLPPLLLRVLLRTWAWLRYCPIFSGGLVRFVDRHFEQLAPLLAAPLLTAELLRHISARRRWRWLEWVAPAIHRHGLSHG